MEITRGDTERLKFQRIDADGNPILTKAEEMYFTVKENKYIIDFLFQKTIDDMTFTEDGYYHFIIEPEDTNKLDFDTYYYDIEVKEPDMNYKKTISKGEFIVDYEITYQENEVE